MLKEQITKQFLIDILDKEENTFGFSMLSILIRKNTPPSNYSTKIREEDVVDPPQFLKALSEAITHEGESLMHSIAQKALFSIECDMIELPKFINDHHVGSIAKWRLKNGI